jgi:hypothetical protein
MLDPITFGAGVQTVIAYATGPDRAPVRVTAATLRIVDLHRHEDDAAREIQAETAAVVDAATAESTEKAGPRSADVRRIEVDEVPTIVLGRRYQIRSGAKRESFVAEAVDDTAIYARDGLRLEYAEGAIVEGLALTATFPAGVANDPDELDLRRLFGLDWSADEATPTKWRTHTRIERRGRPPRAHVDDLLRLDPQLAGLTSGRTTLIANLNQAELELDALLMARRIDPLRFDGGVAGQLAITYRAAELAYRALGGAKHLERAEWCCTEWQRWMEMLRLGKPPIDTVETTASSDRRIESPRRSPFKVG